MLKGPGVFGQIGGTSPLRPCSLLPVLILFFFLGCQRDAGQPPPAVPGKPVLSNAPEPVRNAPAALNAPAPAMRSEDELMIARVEVEIEETKREKEVLLEVEKRLGEEMSRVAASRKSLDEAAKRLMASKDVILTKTKNAGEAAADKPAAPVKKDKSEGRLLKEPTGAAAKTKSPTQVDLSWDAAPQDSGVVSYNVYRDGVFLKSVTSTSLSQSDLKPNTSYCYSIAAVDSQGKESKKTQNICSKTLAPDGEPPTAPSALAVKSAGPSRVDLSWKASSDNIGVKGYNIYQDGDFLRPVEGTSASVDNLRTNARYCFVVTGVDAAGNESSHSEKACAKTTYDDKLRPSAPNSVTAAEISPGNIDLSWGASKDDSGVSAYNIYQDGVFLKAVASNSAFNVKVDTDTTHCYSISARDAAGNESRRSRQVCVTGKKSAEKGKSWGGTIWAGGVNRYGQLGIGNTEDRVTLVMIEGIKGVARVAAADEHTLALKADGTVWAWGRNDKGQLGLGASAYVTVPTEIKGLSSVVDIAVGNGHSVALKSDGTVWVWGRNYYGQLGDGTLADRAAPVQVKELKDVVDIAAGWYHTVALKSDGTVWTWGWNRKGQIGAGEGDAEVINKPVMVKGIANIEMVAAGMEHTVALRSDGTVWLWGSNGYGQLGTGSTEDSPYPSQALIADVESVSAGIEHTVALKKDGSVWSFGSNRYGQAGFATGVKFLKPVLIGGIDGIKEISSGAYHSIAVRFDGTVWAWGWRATDRYASKEAAPAQISGLTGIIDVAAGKRYSIAVKGE